MICYTRQAPPFDGLLTRIARMPAPMRKIRTLEPTVIAAHPGFRTASFAIKGHDAATPETKPDDLWVGFDPVVAWVVHPYVEDTGSDTFVTGATTYPVTPEGILNGGDTYLVGPDGKWSWPGDRDFANETEAREHFIKGRLKRG